MSDRELFDRLAAAARRERPPVVDVAERVLSTIAAPPPLRSDRVFVWMALGSAAAAAACALVALPAWEALADPLAQLMIAFQGVAP